MASESQPYDGDWDNWRCDWGPFPGPPDRSMFSSNDWAVDKRMFYLTLWERDCSRQTTKDKPVKEDSVLISSVAMYTLNCELVWRFLLLFIIRNFWQKEISNNAKLRKIYMFGQFRLAYYYNRM
jgi:hypothetical protein